MDNAIRFAIAILVLFIAMVAFFFAFHPGGVQGVSDPDTMLQWLMGTFDATTGNEPATPTIGTSGSEQPSTAGNPQAAV